MQTNECVFWIIIINNCYSTGIKVWSKSIRHNNGLSDYLKLCYNHIDATMFACNIVNFFFICNKMVEVVTGENSQVKLPFYPSLKQYDHGDYGGKQHAVVNNK